MRSSGRGKVSLDNSLRIRLDVWGDRGGEMRAGQGLQQRVSTTVNGLQYCAQTLALMARAIGWFDLLLARPRYDVKLPKQLGCWRHGRPLTQATKTPSARWVSALLDDLTLLGITPCRRLRKVVCCPLQLQGSASGGETSSKPSQRAHPW